MLYLIVIIITGLSIYCLGNDKSDRQRRYDVLKRARERLINSATVNVKGTVVNSHGTKLDDVEVRIRFNRPKNIWATETESLEEKANINGDFHIKKKGYTSISIRFLKKGYHAKNFTLYTGKKENEHDSSVQNDLKVSLREIGTLVRLITYDERINFDPQNKEITVCDLSNLQKQEITNKTYKNNIPQNFSKCIYLDFEKDSDGNIITESIQRGTPKPQNIPKNYIIKFISGADTDGFVLYSQKNTVSTYKLITYLEEAPKESYNLKEIKLPFNIKNSVFFYIKCGDFYGKGELLAPRIALDGGYNITLKLWINPKRNDRNVRSLN